ncbi:MAG: cytidylate kinase family protein [Pseudomonadota bacterium]
MAVITISRGSFSGGQLLAECVAESLGYRVVSREVIVEAASLYGVSEKKLVEALEKPPNFWEHFRYERRLYLAYLQAVLCEQTRGDNVVYHGHAGHLLLKGVGHVLRVRMIAPLEFRVAAAMERLRLDREGAIQHVQRVDRERTRWTKFLYGVDWADPLNYDLLLNLEHISIEGACSLVRAAVNLSEFRTTAASQQVLEDLLLASRVRAVLASSSGTSIADIEVEARGEVVILRGRLSSEELVAEVVRLAENVPGVRRIDRSALGLWTYTA